MLKCPFCGFANEEGALFCEQCKSDVSSVASAPAAHAMAPPTPMPDSIPPVAMALEEAPVMAAIVDDTPMAAAVVEEEPVAAILEEEPMVAAVIVEEPVVIVEEVPPPAPPPGAMMPAGEGIAPEVVAVPAVAVFAAAVAATPAPAAPAGAKPAGGTPIPPGATIKLVVQRGLKVGEEYNVFAGENFIGRADEKPVDVDLTFQEPEDRVWCSRQHALVVYDDATGTLTVEDLNSANGTFVNRERVYPGQPKQLFIGSTVQVGTVHMRVKA